MDDLLLEPCPLCAGKARFQAGGNLYTITCISCLLETDTYDSPEVLQKDWNSRPEITRFKAENWKLTQQLNILISAIQTDIRKDGNNLRLEDALDKLQGV